MNFSCDFFKEKIHVLFTPFHQSRRFSNSEVRRAGLVNLDSRLREGTASLPQVPAVSPGFSLHIKQGESGDS